MNRGRKPTNGKQKGRGAAARRTEKRDRKTKAVRGRTDGKKLASSTKRNDSARSRRKSDKPAHKAPRWGRRLQNQAIKGQLAGEKTDKRKLVQGGDPSRKPGRRGINGTSKKHERK